MIAFDDRRVACWIWGSAVLPGIVVQPFTTSPGCERLDHARTGGSTAGWLAIVHFGSVGAWASR
eukprot:scaffold55360_cov114-Phaeocystis_antarctica.AAC.1